jgi:hypothetical protein
MNGIGHLPELQLLDRPAEILEECAIDELDLTGRRRGEYQ